MVSFARQYEEITKRGASLVGISVDTVDLNQAMVDKLRLPFPLLSDPDAAVIAAWDVFDPVGGTHGPIARPAIFVVGRDLSLPYEYVGQDYADRPTNDTIYEALDQLRGVQPKRLEATVRGPGPRPLDARSRADHGMPLEEMRPYFRGATFGVQAVAGRVDDPRVKEEAQRFRAIVGDYVKAAIETWKMTRSG